MNSEQKLLEKWRGLPLDRQQEVLDFVEFLYLRTVERQFFTHTPKNQLGERLRQIRTRIITSGEPLLNQEELEKEIASRRGGLESSDE